MQAVTWHGRRDVRVQAVPDPVLKDPTDVIVRVTSTALCGSDLLLYEQASDEEASDEEAGSILGHEAMGIVEVVGAGVITLQPGDRVVVPCTVSCGSCAMCTGGLQSQCETTQVREQDCGAAQFGHLTAYGQVPGGQAELLRVPFGNTLPIKVPHGPVDQRYLYLSDVLPAAWQAVQYADVPEGGSLVVLGLGAIGDMCTRIAQHLGVRQVIGVDLVPERLARAAAHGVTVVDLLEHADELGSVIRRATGGRGSDTVIDAVGLQADGSPAGMAALYSASDLVRRGGTISIAGVYAGMSDPLPMRRLFDKQIQVRMGQANVGNWVSDLLPLLTDDDPLGVDGFATHVLPLESAASAYAMFQAKQDGAIKIVLEP